MRVSPEIEYQVYADGRTELAARLERRRLAAELVRTRPERRRLAAVLAWWAGARRVRVSAAEVACCAPVCCAPA